MESIDKKNKKDGDENLSDSSTKSSSSNTDDEVTPTKKEETNKLINNKVNKSSRNNSKKKSSSKKIVKSSDEDMSDSEMSDVKSESSKESKPNRTSNNNNNNNNSNNKKVKYSSEEESGSDENSSDDEDSSADSSSDSEEDSDSGEEFALSESDDNSDEEDDDDDDDDDDDEDYFEFNRRSKRIKKAKKKAASVNNKKNSLRYPQRQTINNKNNKKNSSAKKTNSTRSVSNKKINYCEDSNDDLTDSEDIIYSNEPVTEDTAKSEDPNVETIEKVLKCRVGKVGATGSKTAIYNIEDHGDPNDNFDKTKEQGENQYFIKWLGWSHLHNTWESKESLLQQRVKGIKKLENFLKKEEENRQGNVMDPSSPEDLEFLECQNEMLDNLLETHRNVERIIASNLVKNPNGTVNEDYLCKWQGLPYSDSTWEDGDLIKKRFPILIEEYEKRQNLTTLPPINVKSQKVLKIRPKFVALKEKPEYLGNYDPELKLRDYQLDGLNWLANSWCKQNSVILADEMGLGKTIQTISFISYVFNEHSLYGPFLIVIPLSTIQGWQRELQKWSPEINVVVYLGDATSRNMIQKYEWCSTNKKIKANVVLTTYEILLKDKSFFNSVSWAVLIVDEAHRLKNEDSLLYQSLIKFDTNHRLLITGTPLQNSLKELWALIHFIMPERFYSWEEFDEKYSSVLQDGLRFQDLHKELQPYLLRRVKKDVEKSLPSKVEQILRVEMTNVQKQYYKLVLTKNYKELSKGAKGNVNSFLNIMMELKKCSNHIYLIRRDDNTVDMEKLIKGSGKLLLLDKLLRRLKETGHRVLIFSQMVRMLDILAEYLQYRRFQFQRLDGSIKGEVRRQALDHFNKEDSEDFCFLLSTRAGGLGINLATADTVIIYDSDWNPQNDLQAQARAHRIGQKNQVNIYRLVSKNSIEEDIVERAKKKMVLDHLVIQSMDTTGRTVLNKSNSTMAFTKEEVNSILKFGAEELFKEKDPTASDQQDEKEELNMYDIDEILKRAETREEDSHHSASDDFLSQFKVANFSTVEDDPILPTTKSFASNNTNTNSNQIEKSWNEIIPEEDRLRAEMEEENEKINLLNLTLGQRRNRGVTSNNNKNKNNQSDDEANTTLKNEYNNSDDEDDYYDEFDKSNNKKRNKKASQYSIKDLNAPELRRFIRSYRKFPSPIDRIDIISQDAHLEEKSQACLIEIAKKLQDLCKTAISNYETKVKAEEQKEQPSEKNNNNKKKLNDKERGPNIILNGVKLNAQQILEAETYFEPLTHYINKENGTKSIEFKTKLKQTYWDCEWNEEDDKSLLIGIYDYGYGNWDWIKADPKLNLDKKILITKMNDDCKSEETSGNVDSTATATAGNSKSNKNIKLKPQSKHLRTRIDYLIKVLKNQINVEKYGDNWKENSKNSSSSNKKSKKKSNKRKEDDTMVNNHNENSLNNSMEVSDTATISLNESSSVRSNNKRKLNSKSSSGDSQTPSRSKRKHNNNSHLSSEFVNRDSDDGSENSESNHDNSKKKRSNNNSNHHHHHHHHHSNDSNMSNNQIDEEMNSDTETNHNSKPSKKQDPKSNKPSKDKKIILDEKTFNECKNLMRPVKKALKNIDVNDGKIEKDDFERVKRHLLEIGDKINDHLTKYSDANKIKEWRNNLWIFVSKFTTMSFDRLKQLYIKFASTRDQEEMNKQITSSSSSSRGGDYGNNNSSNRYYSGSSNTHNNSSSYHKYNNNNDHKQRSSNSGDYWKNEKYFDSKNKNYNNSLSNNYNNNNNNNSSNRHPFTNYHHSSFEHDNFNNSFNGFDSYPDNYDHKNFSSPGSSHFFSKKSSFNSNSNNGNNMNVNKFNNYPPHHPHNHHSNPHHHHHQKPSKGSKD